MAMKLRKNYCAAEQMKVATASCTVVTYEFPPTVI